MGPGRNEMYTLYGVWRNKGTLIHQREVRCTAGNGGSCVYRLVLDMHVAFVFVGF